MEKFKNYEKILIFDFETTGLDFEKDRVIELGALLIEKENEKFVPTKRIDKLVKVENKLSPKIIELTGITDEMLEKDGVEEKEIFDELYSIYKSGNVLFMAYNLQFDITFLNNMFKRNLNDQNFNFDKDVLDVMAIYKDFYGYPWKLDSLVEKLNVQHKNTHRASDDCMATWLGFQELIKQKTNRKIDVYINRIGYNSKYQISGYKMPHVEYIAQYGGRTEIYKKRSL